ncbi:MAG: metallophosphoesterase [Bacteroidales bacterium]|jgi:predicted MPP superfamily phosphohydrolase|nr:metallophosphoesterase [Bacteroidales bacterium]
MKNIGFILVLIIFFGILLSYISTRGFQILGDFKIGKWIYLISSITLFGLFIYTLSYGDTLHSQLANILYFISYTFFIILIYLFLLFVLIDIYSLIDRFWIKLPNDLFLQTRLYAFGIGAGIIVISLIIGNYRFNNPQITKLNLESNKPKLGKSIRIVAASDLHLGHDINKNKFKKYVELINYQNPDLVLFVGDIVDRNLHPVESQKMDEEFLSIKTKFGVYAVSGNHDYYGEGKERNFDFLRKANVGVLLDSSVIIDNSLYIIGRKDRSSRLRKDLKEIVTNLNANLPTILLDHQPYNLSEAEKLNIDIQISGHTHNGQFFPVNIIEKLMYELPFGYKKKTNTHYYVSSGLGIWGPQYRIGSISELLVIDFQY